MCIGYQSQKDDLLAYIRVYGILDPLVGALSAGQLSDLMQHDYGCNCIAIACLVGVYERECSLTDKVSRIQAQLASEVFLDRQSFYQTDMPPATPSGATLAADCGRAGKPGIGVLADLCSVMARPVSAVFSPSFSC